MIIQMNNADDDIFTDLLTQAAILHRGGDLTAALPLYRRALEIKPAEATAIQLTVMLLNQLAISLQGANKFEDAIAYLNDAITLDPVNTRSYLLLGALFRKIDRASEAVSTLSSALSVEPTNSDILGNLSLALESSGDIDRAIPFMERAISIEPTSSTWLINGGGFFLRRGRYDEAIALLQRAVSMDDTLAEAHFNLAIAYNKSMNYQASQLSFQRYLTMVPLSAEAENGLGVAFNEGGDILNAIAAFERAVALKGNYVDALTNLGNCLWITGRDSEADHYLSRAISLDPNCTAAHLGRFFILCKRGDFKEAWAENIYRFSDAGITFNYIQKPWDGSPLNGKSIIVYREQGIGDEIMYSGLYRDLLRMEARAIFECDPRLVSLFKRSFPTAEIYPKEFVNSPSSFENDSSIDFQCPAGDLIPHLRPTIESFPSSRAPLAVDPSRVAHWRGELAKIGPSTKIGITWRSGRPDLMQVKRENRKGSIPLTKWRPLLLTAGVSFINLQYGESKAEIAQVSTDLGITIHTMPDLDTLNNIDDLAALIAALDLTISIPNITYLLSVAVGKTAWAAVGRDNGSYWHLAQGRDLLNPGGRLFFTENYGNWDGLFETISEELNLFKQLE